MTLIQISQKLTHYSLVKIKSIIIIRNQSSYPFDSSTKVYLSFLSSFLDSLWKAHSLHNTLHSSIFQQRYILNIVWFEHLLMHFLKIYSKLDTLGSRDRKEEGETYSGLLRYEQLQDAMNSKRPYFMGFSKLEQL